MLIHLKIEHHLQPLAGSAEVFHVGFWKDVRFRQDDRFSFPPGQELAEGAKHVVLLFRFGDTCSLL